MSLAIVDATIPIFLFMIVQNYPTTSRLMCLMHPVGFPSTFYGTRHFNKHLHEFQPLLVVGSGHENLALLKGKHFGSISTMGRTETSAPLRKVHRLQNGLESKADANSNPSQGLWHQQPASEVMLNKLNATFCT